MFVKHIIKTLHVSVTIFLTQTSREVVTALSTKDGPLKMVKEL